MKYGILTCVITGILTAGCAVSQEQVSSGCAVNASADQQRMLIDGNETATVSGNGFDEDFDLLEDELVGEIVEVSDPLEPLNRIMVGINDALYFWVVKPCAKTCKAAVPEPGRVGIRNFFRNLTTPARLANCLLQGKAEAAGIELKRFVVNTTWGILGFGDPARDKLGLLAQDEDLGQTLATYGVGEGFYIVWPLLGPSTVRDSAGILGDQFLNPVRYVEPSEVSIGISAGKGINESSFHVGEYEEFKSAAVDAYVAMREAYIQYRDKKIRE